MLSHQPIGKDRRDPPTPRVRPDGRRPGPEGLGRQRRLHDGRRDVRADGRPLAVLRLDLDSTVYTFFGRNLTKRSERLRKVTDEAGRSLVFVHDYDEALVQLAEPAAPDRPHQAEVRDRRQLSRSAGRRQLLGAGHPETGFRSRPLGGQLYTFHAVVRVKKPFVPFAPGTDDPPRHGGRRKRPRDAGRQAHPLRPDPRRAVRFRRTSATASRSGSRRMRSRTTGPSSS